MYKKIAEKGHGVMPCTKRDWLHLFSANDKVCYSDFFVSN